MDKKKILIIDDDADYRKIIKIRLELNNFDVVTASNGEEGLDQALRHSPDLIILDIGMPQVDGHTFVRGVKNSEAIGRTPVIILTARGEEMRDLFRMEGVTSYLTKPFEPDELLAEIKTLLKQ